MALATTQPRNVPSLSRKQARSLATSNSRVNLWEGSIRSGKTYVSILRFLIAVAAAGHGGEIVIVGKNRDSIYRNFFKVIEEAPGLRAFRSAVHYRSGAPTASILGREVHVIGANDAKAEAKIRGMTVLLAYVDEVTVIHPEFFRQLLGRMSPDEAMLFGTTNPDSPAHWLKTDYLDKLRSLPSWRHFHFTMDDNPSLSAKYKRDLAAEYTGLWHKRFIEGLWVAAEGAIYDMWDPVKHVRPWAELPQMVDLIGVGVDFGTTNASTGLLLGRSREIAGGAARSRLYLVDEWRYESKGSTTGTLSPSQQARLFTTWLRGKHLPYDTPLVPRFTIVDPAANHFAKELNLLGVRTAGGVNDVSYGISTMASLLSEQQLVVSDRCPGFISEAPGYSWNPKKTAEGKDEPLKVADHSLDGGRYAVVTTERIWRSELDWPLELLAA
jgi:PBSX family phage terminase large subunit